MQDDENIENRRKRLIFRSWHRGTREMDLIMGTFADAQVPGMAADELDLYEEILHTPDPDVYDWLTGRTPVPANLMNPVLQKLLDHDFTRSSALRQNNDG